MDHILQLEDQELITQIKRQVDKNHNLARRFDDTLNWEGLEEKIQAITPSLADNDIYELSVGLHMTGLHETALKLLEKTKNNWSKREKLLKLELLFSNRQFLESLDQAQKLREEFVADPDALINALYFEAKSLLSLNERDQAQIIFEDINLNWPNFRDVPVILSGWNAHSKGRT